MTVGPQWANQSTSQTIQLEPSFLVPQAVLQTAIEPTGNDTTITYYTWGSRPAYMVFLHFADFQNAQDRQFDIYLNGNRLNEKPYSPQHLAVSCISNSEWFRSTDKNYNITLAATATSVLPPVLNAIEIYSLLAFDSPTTFPKDCELSFSTSSAHIFCIKFLTYLWKIGISS